MSQLQMTCHCGALKQTLAGTKLPSASASNIEICHCYGCRHSTGLLYASYYKLPHSSSATINTQTGITKYMYRQGHETVTLCFCSKCGCHAFRFVAGSDGVSVVGVASGTLTHGVDTIDNHVKFGPHVNLESIRDGGIGKWMKTLSQTNAVPHHADTEVDRSPASDDGVLAASCLCKRVNFRIARPNEQSLDPKSNFPDLMMPYHTNDPEIQNPQDVKWWLRQDQTKYLAGLCACKSCRLTSGFEIQSWAFIPRTNIMFETGEALDWGVLDFDGLHDREILRGYESSPGVIREFCPGCGATVFWHDKWRPELIDVSVGLLHGNDGARVESWLDWWTGRVSFVEDAGVDRCQSTAARATKLLQDVESELKRS